MGYSLLTLPLVVKESPWVRDGVRGNNGQPSGTQVGHCLTPLSWWPKSRATKARAHDSRTGQARTHHELAAIVEGCDALESEAERRPPGMHHLEKMKIWRSAAEGADRALQGGVEACLGSPPALRKEPLGASGEKSKVDLAMMLDRFAFEMEEQAYFPSISNSIRTSSFTLIEPPAILTGVIPNPVCRSRTEPR